ncbi:MAG: TRAP transporter substrate-binding protein DctP [Desulfobacterales bacterium]|nr:TRAP transporter substrate-binding protein DctP [Desulfobacterales bacterium]
MSKLGTNVPKPLGRCIIATLLVLIFFSGSAFAKTTIIMAHAMPTDHIFHKISDRFKERLKELSNDAFEIQYHPGGALGDWTSQVDQAMAGAIHINLGWALSELDPRLDVAQLGFIANDWDVAAKIYGIGGVLDSLYKEIYSNLGLTSLGTIPTGFTGFVVRKGVAVPVNVPEDAHGFKMRVPPYPMAIARYKALGFSVVPMPFSEVHTALQTGAIDGRAYSPSSEVMMFRDTLEAYVYTKEHFEQTFFFTNSAWLNSLPEQDRKWITQAAEEAIAWSWTASKQDLDEWLVKIRESGLQVVELTPEQHDKYAKIVLDTELPIVEKLIGKEKLSEILKVANIKR